MPTILMRPHGLMFIAFWAGFLVSSDISAQVQKTGIGPGAVYLSKAESDTLVDLSTVPWRFQDGDNPTWADPAFDDADWDLMDTDFQPDTLYPEIWQGLGC